MLLHGSMGIDALHSISASPKIKHALSINFMLESEIDDILK